jgi:C4-dicarboxylate-specific signal transduction histidine kinase
VSVGEWVTAVLGALSLIVTAYFAGRALRSTTRADQAQAARDRQREIAEARVEERATCEARVNDLLRDNAELARERDERTRERDFERARADNLQNIINRWRVQGDS